MQAFLAAGFQKVITYFDVPEISEPIFVSSHRYSWSYYRVCKSDFSSNRPPAAGHREAGLTGINIGILTGHRKRINFSRKFLAGYKNSLLLPDNTPTDHNG